MISNILNLLKINKFYNQSEAIEIAKGKYELPTTFKIGYRKITRQLRYKL